MKKPAKDVRIDTRGRIELPKRRRGACRWCGKTIKAKRRRHWCGKECVTAYDNSSTTGVKSLVRRRDKGICGVCGIDTIALKKGLPTEDPYRTLYLREYNIPKFRVRTRWSDIHHIRPASEGGKMILSNLQTVCLPCHAKETREWKAAKRRESTP